MYVEEGGDSGHEHTKICSLFLRELTELHQFRKQLSYDGDLSPSQV